MERIDTTHNCVPDLGVTFELAFKTLPFKTISFKTYAPEVGLVVLAVNEVTLLHADTTNPFQTMSFKTLSWQGLCWWLPKATSQLS